MCATDSLVGYALNALSLAPLLPPLHLRVIWMCFSRFIYSFKGRSVNRSPPTRGFGTAACARTRTRQKLLSAWCVMSGRGRQRGKRMDIRQLSSFFALVLPRAIACLWVLIYSSLDAISSLLEWKNRWIPDYLFTNIATVRRVNMKSLQSSCLGSVVCVPKLNSVQLKPVLFRVFIPSPWWWPL